MKITLIEGFGFGEQSHLKAELLLREMQVQTYDVDAPYDSSFKVEAESSSLVIFRSRWSATAEENLFNRILIKQHHAYFEALDELLKDGKTKVVAVGRGALLWLEWMRKQGRLGSPVRWRPEAVPTSSWIETMIHTRQHTKIAMRSLINGRALINGLNLGGEKVSPWVEYQDKPVGWIVNDNLYLSTVDVFALSERAQQSDYGYEDLSLLATRSNLIQLLLSGDM